MQPKGYLTRDGRVVRGYGPDTIASLHHKETRYNLRRMYVVRTWIAIMEASGQRFEANTRRDVIELVMAWGPESWMKSLDTPLNL